MNQKATYKISLSKLHKFIIKNGGTIFIIICFLLLLTAYLGNAEFDYFRRLLNIIIIIGIVFFTVGRVLRLFAYAIEINFELETITFQMFRSWKNFEVPFSRIKDIKKKTYLVFHTDNKKFFYNGELSTADKATIKKVLSSVNTNKY